MAASSSRLRSRCSPRPWSSRRCSRPTDGVRLGVARRFTLGPVLGISPFNFPLNLVAHKVAPALGAGNTIVVKPAPATPISSLLLGEILVDAGVGDAMSVLLVPNEDTERAVGD